jgi:hypothetical protein
MNGPGNLAVYHVVALRLLDVSSDHSGKPSELTGGILSSIPGECLFKLIVPIRYGRG